jgi:hypothetical protein
MTYWKPSTKIASHQDWTKNFMRVDLGPCQKSSFWVPWDHCDKSTHQRKWNWLTLEVNWWIAPTLGEGVFWQCTKRVSISNEDVFHQKILVTLFFIFVLLFIYSHPTFFIRIPITNKRIVPIVLVKCCLHTMLTNHITYRVKAW